MLLFAKEKQRSADNWRCVRGEWGRCHFSPNLTWGKPSRNFWGWICLKFRNIFSTYLFVVLSAINVNLGAPQLVIDFRQFFYRVIISYIRYLSCKLRISMHKVIFRSYKFKISWNLILKKSPLNIKLQYILNYLEFLLQQIDKGIHSPLWKKCAWVYCDATYKSCGKSIEV